MAAGRVESGLWIERRSSMDVWFKSKGQWLVGIGGGYLFGDRIRIADQILSDISTSRGQLLSLNGNYGDYKLFQRGFTFSGQIGRSLPNLDTMQTADGCSPWARAIWNTRSVLRMQVRTCLRS